MRKSFLCPKEVCFVSRKDLHDPESHHLSSSLKSDKESEDNHLWSVSSIRTGVDGRVLLLYLSECKLRVFMSLFIYSVCSSPRIIIRSVSLSVLPERLSEVIGVNPSLVSSEQSSRHTACSNFDLGRSGHRSCLDLLRPDPDKVISTVFLEDGRSYGSSTCPLSSLCPLRRGGACSSLVGVLLAGASSNLLLARRLAPGLSARLVTSGTPRRAVLRVLPGE